MIVGIITIIAILSMNYWLNDSAMKVTKIPIKQAPIKKFINISEMFSQTEFENIKNFILSNGNRQTYRNYDNNNPHYDYGDFSAYLGADIGQGNINNDKNISDFNKLVIMSRHTGIKYYALIIVREGDITYKEPDIKRQKTGIVAGMKEGNVYLVYDRGLESRESLKAKILPYITTIKSTLNLATNDPDKLNY
ncbi:hypothetical protein MNBD_GAMMA03-894 [hydrothermal vent metagenome]|uniref:Uncharacterized protein n=1 Tax=hydrothermal vent metagenome TaxID=652676 RepID=A0A3B0VVQ3_9ZZZZ